MINITFDFETADFVDDEAKAAWFEFCESNLDDAAPKVEKPEADTEADAEKPVPPAKKTTIPFSKYLFALSFENNFVKEPHSNGVKTFVFIPTERKISET